MCHNDSECDGYCLDPLDEEDNFLPEDDSNRRDVDLDDVIDGTIVDDTIDDVVSDTIDDVVSDKIDVVSDKIDVVSDKIDIDTLDEMIKNDGLRWGY